MSDITIKRDMGIYLHIPFCKLKCSYCDFASYQGLQDYYEDYTVAICKEIDLWVKAHPECTAIYSVSSVYFGGGTPTQLSIDQLTRIVNKLKQYFDISNVEMTIEANPGEISFEYLCGLHILGYNRISFGVQTFDEDLLKLLHRGHTKEEALEAIYNATEAGFRNISVDLIYALPNQNFSDLKQNLDIVATLPIQHISIYGLQLEKGTYLEKLVREGKLDLPSEEEVEAMYDYMIYRIQDLGFERYEISNFAKAEQYSSHNLKYWHYVDYLGFGVGAHSFYNGVRSENNSYVVPYINRLANNELPVVNSEVIDLQRNREDYCYLALRTKWGINVSQFNERFDKSFDDCYDIVVKRLLSKKLLEYDSILNTYRLTESGAKHGNYVFAQFIE